MILRTVPLDFNRAPGYAVPKDPALHKMLVEFSEKNLVQQPNFADDFLKVWVVAEFDENEKPLSVQGVGGYVMRPDVTLFRSLNERAMLTLYKRINGFLADAGCLGMEGLVYVNPNEQEKQRCPDVAGTLKVIKAVPANRWSVIVR